MTTTALNNVMPGFFHLWQRRPAWWLVCLAGLAVLGAWLSTLQRDIGASDDPSPEAVGIVASLMDDSAEFVIAWHTWGVSHPPGYPLLNLLGNLLTPVLAWVTPTPVAAAGLVSLLCSLGALGFLAALVWQATHDAAAAVVAFLLPALGRLTWLYAGVAEVYGLGLFLALAALVTAVAVGAQPTPRRILALGLVCGLAVGHHRTLAALGPALLYAAWPARRAGWRVWLGAAALAILSLGVYAYLPITAAAGSPWVYGRSPATWPGFLDALLGREYGAQLWLRLDSWTAAWALLVGRWRYVAQEMTAPGLILGLVGLTLGISRPHTRRLGITLGLVFTFYCLAPVSQSLLIGTHLLIMVSNLVLGGGWGLGLAGLMARRSWLGAVGLVLTAAVLLFAWRTHRPEVLTYTQDSLGRQIIEAVKGLDDPRPTVAAVWGPRYFALAYGKWVTGELASIELLNSWANLANLPPPARLPPVIYTLSPLLYVAGPEQWATWRGGPVYLESAEDGVVAVRSAPRLIALAEREGDSAEILLHAAHAWLTADGDVRLTAEWLAQRQPTTDYHVFAHVTDKRVVAQPTDILAQGDRAHPVYGFSPTSRWVAGQLVRDDYRISLPPASRPRTVIVGLYTTAPDGRFINYLSQSVPIQDAP